MFFDGHSQQYGNYGQPHYGQYAQNFPSAQQSHGQLQHYDPYGGHGAGGHGYMDQVVDDVEDKQLTPETVHRTCTDCIWCCLFLVCFVGFIGVWIYASVNGKYDRFFDLRDDKGQLCGNDLAVRTKPYLFFCIDGANAFHYGSRKCVETCPTTTQFGTGGDCGAAYPTKRYFENICIPTEIDTAKAFFDVTTDHPSFTMVMSFSDIPRGSWKPIVISACVVVVGAFLYLLLIQCCAKPLFYIGIFTIIIASSLLSVYFFYAAATGGADGWPYTGDSSRDWLVGLCGAAFAALFLCIVICRKDSLERAIFCLKAAGECIWDVPILLLEPFFNLAGKGIAFIILMLGFLLLLSCGTVDVGTTTVNFHYGAEEWWLVGYYVFMTFWILELCSAFHHFVVSYAVETWFFSDVNSQQMHGQHGSCLSVSLCKGYFAAWRYHLGTLSAGSLIVAILKVIHLAISIMEEASKDTGNKVLECVACIIRCCVQCCIDCVKHLTKNAYMAVALNADAFCPAAKLAVKILSDNATAVITLKGATFFFELAGLGGLTAGGVYLTFLQLKWSPEFNQRQSASYVADPSGTLIAAGIVCFIVAWPFMALFANAADVILFCYAVEQRRKVRLAKLAEGAAQGAFSSVTGFFSSFFGGGSQTKPVQNHGWSGAGNHPETQAMLNHSNFLGGSRNYSPVPGGRGYY